MTQDLQGLFADGGGNKLMFELSSKQSKMGREGTLLVLQTKFGQLHSRRGTQVGMLVSSLNKMRQFFFLCHPPH
jgi:hypothetical protein